MFKEAIDKWHIKYLEAKLPGLTPDKLLKMVEDKMQILKHAGQWKLSDHPEIMALKLELQQQKTDSEHLLHNLVAHVGKLSSYNRSLHNKHQNNNNNNGNKHPLHDGNPTKNYPTWMMDPPSNPAETKLVDHRIYTWCTKCWQG